LQRIPAGQALNGVVADTVPALFHRSCGKACGKGAPGSYKFLKILYF
jgi:hypothetical protein